MSIHDWGANAARAQRAARYPIEKGVPLPDHQRRGSQNSRYPFPDMEVGDSFAFEEHEHRRVAQAAHAYKKRTGRGFTVRRVDGGGRCWRIK